MVNSKTTALFEKLAGLRTELIDLAFVLECRGRLDAADVAMTTSARVGELCEELLAAGSASSSQQFSCAYEVSPPEPPSRTSDRAFSPD